MSVAAPLRTVGSLVVLLAPATLAGCRSEPTTIPLTEQEKAEYRAEHMPDPTGGRIADKGTLFMTLDQNLRSWRTLTVKNNAVDVEQRLSLEYALAKEAYCNFDAVLAELEHGTDPEHRMVAAGAIGFARVPLPGEPGADPKYPAVHPRAVAPLLRCLEEGNDELAINALLSLARLGSPDTPLDLLIEMMVTHHSEDVRANAALALSSLVQPKDAALALPPLFSALADPSPKVRLHAVRALGRLKDRSSQSQLIAILRRDPVPLVQSCAAISLSEVGDEVAVDSLIDGLASDTELLARACRRSLVKLTGQAGRGSSEWTQKEWRDWWKDCPRNPANRSASK